MFVKGVSNSVVVSLKLCFLNCNSFQWPCVLPFPKDGESVCFGNSNDNRLCGVYSQYSHCSDRNEIPV